MKRDYSGPSYWVNDGATNFDGQEWRNKFRGENQKFCFAYANFTMNFKLMITHPRGGIARS